jgi:hypothetical protein
MPTPSRNLIAASEPLNLSSLILFFFHFYLRVIQYITWGDGSPAPDYDHGTWCGGSAIGRCNTSNTLANEYNGIAYNGQITMFDIDIADNFLNVPSLYNIALPPAYGAGTPEPFFCSFTN